jgi:hypothetical protein
LLRDGQAVAVPPPEPSPEADPWSVQRFVFDLKALENRATRFGLPEVAALLALTRLAALDGIGR